MTARDHAVFAARLNNTPRIREFVKRACAAAAIGEDDCFALALAVDEACTNIVEHGYRPGEAGEILLEFEVEGETARVTIVDTGRPFDPADVPPPDLTGGALERPVGGLGVHLIHASMDEVHYRAEPAGNRLVLIKKLQGRSQQRPRKE
jgi:anti-sigma regulatory factor (Ser/Thr protein kinase)